MRGEKGIAALEFALILPILLVLSFGTIDFGRLIYARLIITNVSREGGSLTRFFSVADPSTISDLFAMLQQSGMPLNLSGSGKIWISQITAGHSEADSNPAIVYHDSHGGLSFDSVIGAGNANFGLSPELYNHLVFNAPPQNASDIQAVWVVEVFYLYQPITPLPNFIEGILHTPGYDGIVLGSKAVFSGGT